MRPTKRQVIIVAMSLVLALVVTLPTELVHGQQGNLFSPGQVLFASPYKVFQPLMATGRDGSVHLFWELMNPPSQLVLPQELIYYSRWNGTGWTTPVDIISAVTAKLAGAAVDAAGNIHLLWWGPNGSTMYSRARANDANSARAWSPPSIVAHSNTYGQVVADSSGLVHRVYGGLDQLGPYYQVSRDSGTTWSAPVNIARTSSPDASADWERLAVDRHGVLHVVWTEWTLPTGWPPLGVYYARSADGGKTWSKPVKLTGEGYDQANVVVAGNDEVHVAWNAMVTIRGRYHRWSADGGKTWSPTNTLTSQGGTEGPPQFAVDSGGTLYLSTTHGSRVWLATWSGGVWSPLEYVSTGDETGIPPVEQSAESVRWTEQSALGVSGGDRLNVAFWDRRTGVDRDRFWYTYRETGASATAGVPFPARSSFIGQEKPQATASVARPDETPEFRTSILVGDLPRPRDGFGDGVLAAAILPMCLLLMAAGSRARR